MQNITSVGFSARKSMGQSWGTTYGSSLAPVRSPVPAPVLAPTAASERAVPINAGTRDAALEAIAKAKKNRKEMAAWWDSNPNAREILGADLEAYAQNLTDSMAHDELIDRLEFRLSQSDPNSWLMTNSEMDGLRNYQTSTDKLYGIVQKNVPKMQLVTASMGGMKDLWIPAGIAVGALVASLYVKG